MKEPIPRLTPFERDLVRDLSGWYEAAIFADHRYRGVGLIAIAEHIENTSCWLGECEDCCHNETHLIEVAKRYARLQAWHGIHHPNPEWNPEFAPHWKTYYTTEQSMKGWLELLHDLEMNGDGSDE